MIYVFMCSLNAVARNGVLRCAKHINCCEWEAKIVRQRLIPNLRRVAPKSSFIYANSEAVHALGSARRVSHTPGQRAQDRKRVCVCQLCRWNMDLGRKKWPNAQQAPPIFARSQRAGSIGLYWAPAHTKTEGKRLHCLFFANTTWENQAIFL